uniref:Uncharacterized protein n=1 Tax=Sipha flava TaxID=143950 RepID=A0A2S2QLA3_9HEMI
MSIHRTMPVGVRHLHEGGGVSVAAAGGVSLKRAPPTCFKGERAWAATPRKAVAYEYSNQFRVVVLYLGRGCAAVSSERTAVRICFPGTRACRRLVCALDKGAQSDRQTVRIL